MPCLKMSITSHSQQIWCSVRRWVVIEEEKWLAAAADLATEKAEPAPDLVPTQPNGLVRFIGLNWAE